MLEWRWDYQFRAVLAFEEFKDVRFPGIDFNGEGMMQGLTRVLWCRAQGKEVHIAGVSARLPSPVLVASGRVESPSGDLPGLSSELL